MTKTEKEKRLSGNSLPKLGAAGSIPARRTSAIPGPKDSSKSSILLAFKLSNQIQHTIYGYASELIACPNSHSHIFNQHLKYLINELEKVIRKHEVRLNKKSRRTACG